MRSTLHIFCKFGLALVRTSLVVFRLAPRTEKKKKKKGQRHPHSHQLTEVSNPYTFSLSEAQHLFQVQTFFQKKKKSAVRSTLHIFCKFGLALVRTSLVVFRLAPRTEKKKKKGQRHPHSHQLTEVRPFFFLCVCVRRARRKKTKEIRTSARPNLQKMWRVDRTFFLEGGLNLEQVLGLA